MNKNIRNFCIIAHIDHGKSTFSNKIIEICNKKKIYNKKIKILDSMELEKEKGITIKAQSINLKYKYKKKKYNLNLIDTPGHIDFNNEVSKSLYICEGAILLIDASKGIQSQTLHNYNIAKKFKLKIITVINKIDIKNINIYKIEKKIKKKLKIKNILKCSSKTGDGIKNVIKKIIKIIPYPKGNINKPLNALIIDSYFDNYLGTFLLIKIYNGKLNIKDKIKILDYDNKYYYIENIIINSIKIKKLKKLISGEIGWISCNIKIFNKNPIGKTLTLYNIKNIKKIKFKKSKPQLFVSIFPYKNKNFNNLKKSIEKLNLNDSSFTYKLEKSNILGFGFRCGFLGILHIDIIKERLKREYNMNILITNPNITFKIKNKNNETLYINNIDKISYLNIKYIKEPIVKCNIITPQKYIGKIINLCIQKRSEIKNIIYIKKYSIIKLKIPLLEIIIDFNDKIKSITQGYATFNYKFYKYKKSKIVILKVLINKILITNLSTLIHISNIRKEGKRRIDIIKKNIKKQLFNIDIKILCNNKIILKTVIKALKKNVITKCYGGDITRKKKLIYKQKKGKKKMKKIGKIYINNKIFSKILKIK